jgi:hypothetical protein
MVTFCLAVMGGCSTFSGQKTRHVSPPETAILQGQNRLPVPLRVKSDFKHIVTLNATNSTDLNASLVLPDLLHLTTMGAQSCDYGTGTAERPLRNCSGAGMPSTMSATDHCITRHLMKAHIPVVLAVFARRWASDPAVQFLADSLITLSCKAA